MILIVFREEINEDAKKKKIKAKVAYFK